MAPAPKKKALKIGRALKRLPARVGGRGNGNAFSPLPGEHPVVFLRVQVLSCTNLLAKDRNGYSDPFVVVSLLANRQQTPVAKRTVNPAFNPKDATFDFPIYLSLADKLGVVELVVWDKDVLKKDYLGEVSIPLEDWFRDGNAFPFDDVNNKMISRNLVSTRNSTHATGSIQLKLGFVAPSNTTSMDYGDIYSELVKRTRPSLVSAPPVGSSPLTCPCVPRLV
ncbi:C2 domain-containing protein [Trametes punicea]|nr:C2 domain-containing protein [Trametes punicea]